MRNFNKMCINCIQDVCAYARVCIRCEQKEKNYDILRRFAAFGKQNH